MLAPLPIDPLLPDLVRKLSATGVLVLSAPPGAGKTTRVPRALLDRADLGDGDIVVLEPRRLAARVAAMRVAEELGERVGERIGFQTRFERAISRATRVRFITEGILGRRLLSDPQLKGTRAVLLDEFHERHLQTDVALGHLASLRKTSRPDLMVLPMSATLDAGPVAEFLGAEVLASEGRAYPVEIEHLKSSDDRPLASQVASAVRRVVTESETGHILVFLPGAREIRAAAAACASIAATNGLSIMPLHGTLSVEEQDRAVRPGAKRKLILSTNVAETSVTIDGVTAVIDSGLAFSAEIAPWSGMPTLRLAKVSKASATQRAGRAGRTAPGKCLRLYTSGDFMGRLAFETPEIRRLDVCETVLELVASGIRDVRSFAWFEAPDPRRLEVAIDLLASLGAVHREAGGALTLTDTGKRMVRFPIHPRQARMVVEAERRGVARDGAVLAALVAERDVRAQPAEPYRGAPQRSDLVAALDAIDEARDMGRERQRAIGLDPQRVDRVLRVAKELEGETDRAAKPPLDPRAHESALEQIVLAGYPDRVGRLRHPEAATGRRGVEIVLAGGGTATLAESSVVRAGDLVVAVDAEERTETGRAKAMVRWASAVEMDHVLEMLVDDIVDEAELVFVENRGRVEEVRRLRLGALVLEEQRTAPRDLTKAGEVLARALLTRPLDALGGEGIDMLKRRIAFVRKACPDANVPELDESATRLALERACEGKTSVSELGEVHLLSLVEAWLGPDAQRKVRELAPERVTLHPGRSVAVDYPPDGSPSIESRLQDFFGLKDGPRIAGGRVPLVLHLLAPNQRAVQVTTDLAGFWARHYPAVAKELRRKYPRHPFPDDPLTATPPPPRRR